MLSSSEVLLDIHSHTIYGSAVLILFPGACMRVTMASEEG